MVFCFSVWWVLLFSKFCLGSFFVVPTFTEKTELDQ